MEGAVMVLHSTRSFFVSVPKAACAEATAGSALHREREIYIEAKPDRTDEVLLCGGETGCSPRCLELQPQRKASAMVCQ